MELFAATASRIRQVANTLYLHIGSPKAASSTIQQYLHRNAAALRDLGYTLAAKDLRPGSQPGEAIWFFSELDSLPRDEAAGILAARVADIGEANIVVSAEYLARPSMAALFESLSNKIRMRVLYVIRRQDDWIYSAWKQWHSKIGHSLDRFIADALRDHIPNYPKVVEAWQRAAGTDSVRLLSLDMLGGDVLNTEILNWLELDDGATLSSSLNTVANPTFDFRIVDLLARHPGTYDDAHDNRVDTFLTRYSRLAYRHKFRLSGVDSARILEHFHADNVLLLGEERTAALTARSDSKKLVAKAEDPQREHDFALACLFEALGRMTEELHRTRIRVARLEKRLAGDTDRDE